MEEGRSPPVRLLGDDARVSVSQLSDALRRRGAAPDEGAGQEAPPTACPVPAGDAIGPSLAAAAASGVPLVLDVRPACQFRTAHLRGTVCAPLSSLRRSSKALAEHAADPRKAGVEIVTLCRRGNDSQLAAQVLSQAGFTNVKDVVGGLEAWRAEVDSSFPDF